MTQEIEDTIKKLEDFAPSYFDGWLDVDLDIVKQIPKELFTLNMATNLYSAIPYATQEKYGEIIQEKYDDIDEVIFKLLQYEQISSILCTLQNYEIKHETWIKIVELNPWSIEDYDGPHLLELLCIALSIEGADIDYRYIDFDKCIEQIKTELNLNFIDTL